MGKGTISGGGTDGLYNVQVNYDRAGFDAEISSLDAALTEVNGEILLHPDDSALRARRLSLEKRRAYLVSKMPDDEIIQAWCADLTENLTGVVATVEIPGESVAFNIHPGYEGAAAYDSARDGQLVPTVAQNPAQAYYNLAMLPGWQKWKPTYRYGTITYLDGDSCGLDLDTATSSQQGLGVNQAASLAGVPIEYMDCNGAAFGEGDAVLVQFRGQNFTAPRVVGFKDNPQPCGVDFFIKPIFNTHRAVKGGQSIKVGVTVGGTLIEDERSVYGTDNPAPDPVLEGLVDFRGTALPASIFDPAFDTTVSLASNGPMTVVNQWTDPAAIASLEYMAGFTFLHYYSSTSADYDFQHGGVYFKEVPYKVGDYFLLAGDVTQVAVGGKIFDVYEMDFSNLSTLKHAPDVGALANKNPWIFSMANAQPGPGTYGPWLDVRYSNLIYYPTASGKAVNYKVRPTSAFQDQILDDWLYGQCVADRGWYANLKELNRAASDTLGLGGITNNLPAGAWAILSDQDGGNPTFANYSVTRTAGTYRFYYLQDCTNSGLPAIPEEGGEDHNPYSWTWACSIVETPPQLW